MDLVHRVVPLTERRPRKTKRAIYEIVDPYVLFWHRLVAPLVHDGSVGLADPALLWESRVAPRLDEHMGTVFDQICRECVLLAGECKWGDVTQRDLARLSRRATRMAVELGEIRHTQLVLFTGSGRADQAVVDAAARGEVLLVGPDELA